MGFVCFLVFVGGLNDIEDVIVDTWVGGLDLFDLFALSRLTTLIAISLEQPSTNENTVDFDSRLCHRVHAKYPVSRARRHNSNKHRSRSAICT